MSEHELRAAYEARLTRLEALALTLERATKQHLEGLPHIDRIAFRAKRVDSFVEKARRKAYESPLDQVEDQVAGRVIVFYRDEIEPMRARLAEIFGAVEEAQHEPEDVSSFSYESFHSIVVIPAALTPEGWSDVERRPTTFELQIRTLFQHAYAESEHDLVYKPPLALERDEQRKIAWVAASAWGADEVLGQAKASIHSRVDDTAS